MAILKANEQDGARGILRFPRRLGIKPMAGYRSIMELAWAPDGRCTWQFGANVRAGMYHVIWRRIGSHDIYQDP